ncbi:MAG: S41 family peptidase [Ignavibacteria bacterium]|nr:S41 family peptidase [Ignavibacteria bacterium]
MSNKKFYIPVAIILIVIGIFIGTRIQKAVSNDKVEDQIKKYAEVLKKTSDYYVDDVDTQKLTEAAIKGLLSELDPHSIYITKEQLKRVNEDFQGSFEGIGVEFDIINDTLTVISPIVGGPSEKLGILAGDKIVKIDGQNVIKISREDVPKKLRGPKGTKVTVSIIRGHSTELLEFEITRDKIPLYSVDASLMYNNEIGYIRISRFSATTFDEFIQALNKLKNSGMKKLVLDLRGNPGGYMNQSVKMASQFLPKGKKIVYTKSRVKDFNEEYFSSGGDFLDIPLVVLVNEGSASASEIVSGAIQDWDRGLIVGTPTFGKGLVQQQLDIFDGSAIRITTSRYYTPAGRTIQKPYEGGKYISRNNGDSEDGDNFEHNKDVKDTTKPVYKTFSGRTIYGGGGITPDYIVKVDTLTNYTVQFRRLNLIYIIVEEFMKDNRSKIESTYKNYKDFISGYQINEQLLNDLIAAGKEKGIEYDQVAFEKDKNFIVASVLSQIARDIWGNEGSYAVFINYDEQFLKAVSLLDEAAKLLNN